MTPDFANTIPHNIRSYIQSNQEEKNIKGFQTIKDEVKLFLFAHDMYLYKANPKYSMTILEKIDKYCRMQNQHTRISCIPLQ